MFNDVETPSRLHGWTAVALSTCIIGSMLIGEGLVTNSVYFKEQETNFKIEGLHKQYIPKAIDQIRSDIKTMKRHYPKQHRMTLDESRHSHADALELRDEPRTVSDDTNTSLILIPNYRTNRHIRPRHPLTRPTLATVIKWNTHLQPWENESVVSAFSTATAVCNPPTGGDLRCCVGSTSAGGDIFWKPSTCVSEMFESFVPVNTRYTERDLIDFLSQTELRMTLAGDSVMYQNMVGFQCAWLRQGCRNVHYQKFKREKIFWKYGIGTIEHYQVSCKTSNAQPADVTFYLQYRPHNNMSEVREMLENTDVYYFNTGLHYISDDVDANFKEETQNWLRVVYDWLKSNVTRVAFFRETTAQHRDAMGGEWNMPLRNENATGCAPNWWTAHNTIKPNWRNNMVKRWASEIGFTVSNCDGKTPIHYPSSSNSGSNPRLHWIPFYSYSSRLVHMHPGEGFGSNHYKCEPTHICGHPEVWTPSFSAVTETLTSQHSYGNLPNN